MRLPYELVEHVVEIFLAESQATLNGSVVAARKDAERDLRALGMGLCRGGLLDLGRRVLYEDTRLRLVVDRGEPASSSLRGMDVAFQRQETRELDQSVSVSLGDDVSDDDDDDDDTLWRERVSDLHWLLSAADLLHSTLDSLMCVCLQESQLLGGLLDVC